MLFGATSLSSLPAMGTRLVSSFARTAAYILLRTHRTTLSLYLMLHLLPLLLLILYMLIYLLLLLLKLLLLSI